MLPIADYGSIAITIPHVVAVGSLLDSENHMGFEVFLTGLSSPITIGFSSTKEAGEAREDLIGMVAQYHVMKMLGPDFDISELDDEPEENIHEH